MTLNQLRCNDFFAQRGANQTRERVLRSTVAPVSALLTGIIGIVAFSSDASRQEAIQILGISHSATIAGLELYESEFLFGASNINSVRTLTMRSLDEHSTVILAENVGFYTAVRRLIYDQMLCTPANILELTQTAIREGRVASSTPVGATNDKGTDQASIAVIASSLRMSSLTPDQLGSLWWLTNLVDDPSASQDLLVVLHDRLSGLPVNPISQNGSRFVVNNDMVRPLIPLFRFLSPDVTTGFNITSGQIMARIAETTPPTVLDRTKGVRFDVPPQTLPPVSRSTEVGVQPASTPSQ